MAAGKRVAALAAIVGGCLALVPPATASVGPRLPHLGVIPLGKGPTTQHFAVPKGYQGTSGLTYHQGSVMRTNTTHAIYWQGSASNAASNPFPATYETLINRFLSDVATDSGTRGNVYSTDIQYFDQVSNIQYKSSFGGSLVDTTPYPTVGCVPTSVNYNHCITDDQLMNELDSFLSAHPSLPRGLGHVYFVYLPPGVQTCDDTSTDCSGVQYCAYHSGFFENNSSAPVTLYANQPFVSDVNGCITGVTPNDANADPTIDATSHEHNEAITDPLGDAWYDDKAPSGEGENGDLCNTSYGPAPPGGFTTTSHNQTIGGHFYFIQSEWSNLDGGCALNLAKHAPLPKISASRTRAATKASITLDGSGSSDPDGAIVSYHWNFGDGTSANGPTVSHAYQRTGTRTVTLTVTDNDFLTTSAKVKIAIVNDKSPVASIKLPSNVVAGRSARYDGRGSHDPDGQVVAYRWHFGDHTRSATGKRPRHTYARAGTYRVQLTVTDDLGRKSSKTKKITVAPR